MSQAAEFVRKIYEDEALSERIWALPKEQRDPQSLVALGAEMGLSFTTEELENAWGEHESEQSDTELSDAQLERVSGGAATKPPPEKDYIFVKPPPEDPIRILKAKK